MKKFEVIISGSHFDEKLKEITRQRFHRYVSANTEEDASARAFDELIPQIQAGFYKGIYIIHPLDVTSIKEVL